MTLVQIQDRLKQAMRKAALELFGIEIEQLQAEIPPRPELGDLAFPVSFELAKLIKQGTGVKTAPRAIAEQLKAKIENSAEVARVEVAGAGYLNVFFDRARLLSSFVPETQPQSVESSSVVDRPKKMVEHTSINPNKAAHIGHVRNAVLGDTFVRILQAANERVEIQNYIDNTGVQVADVVVGFMHIEKLSLDEIKALDTSLPATRPFDYYCWDLYTRVGLFYRGGDATGTPLPERLKLRTDVLHALEAGNNSIAELADYVATRNVECILDTMERLGIRYDLLARESDILHLHFWDRAFELMRDAQVIHLQTEGKHAGCWVMPFESHTGTDEHESDKIIVRSNGTVTYTGKDIAYQLWKLGRLGLDFNYKPFRSYGDGQVAWVTTTEPNAEILPEVPRPNFGGGVKVYNVIDSRQAYPQEIVARGVAAVVPDVGADASVHFGYEMVALSPRACEELGIELSDDDRARPFIEMSGRKGLGVKADDLINRLEIEALREVSSRHPELSADQQEATAHEIAVGALRYFLLKFTRNSVIAFDFKEALSFEGETGPYCQYAAVRANSIFRKLDTETINRAEALIRTTTAAGGSSLKLADVLEDEAGTEIWSLVMLAERLDEVMDQCAASAEPANLAKYTFTLARAFNLFYHRHRIISEEDETKRALLIVAANIARRRLTAALATLGIAVPERM
ncbi:MAG TPA: DALR anticodon-binding domain-containing protein [Pyrinomonadaceae bacterium]|nr:DALR anticodon-binding domain-containing protein [Pyrinomonadaceae bacterium]